MTKNLLIVTRHCCLYLYGVYLGAIMKVCCGAVKTIKGAVAFIVAFFFAVALVRLVADIFRIGTGCARDDSICIAFVVGLAVVVLLFITLTMLRRKMPIYFPVSCGHRKLIFTGTSSKSLEEILLCVEQNIPTEEELRHLKEGAQCYLNDIKVQLEKAARVQMKLIFSGSTVERYGIPRMLLGNSCCAGFSLGSLHTDLDVMICPMAVRACFSGQGDIHLAPLFIDGVKVIGYTKLFCLPPMHKTIWTSPMLVINKVKDAVKSTPLLNFPKKPWYVLAPKIHVESKGPALKISVPAGFELDVTFCFYCPEWPTNSDWPSRPRYWPSMADAQRIMSLGCHVVAKSAPSDKENESWRFSFSVAECELSKLVPDTAKKCFLALKIILKDHLQPVVPEIGSYHIKTIFLNTMEKLPVGFWADENIERCFLTLLKELHIALWTMKCPHHWFSSINLFSAIKAEKLQLLAKKVQRILQDPSPFILDDGCCCVSSCCVRVPEEHSTSRDIQEISADYEESPICVRASDDGMCRENNFVDLWHDVNSLNVHKVSVKVTPNKEQNPSQRMEDHQILADDLDLLIQDV